jgi:predicted regulator of Ras-like GTPase activity (Roadblock/LC7/MglB family)
MLQSLFGDLGPAIDPSGKRRRAASDPDQGFAATAILESVNKELNDHGQIVDRHVRDLMVTGSPAQAIREHFKATRADLDTASHLITLLDPAGVWATSVIKAVSDAGGQPIEKLHLREQSTLRTLAMIERTALVRRAEDALKIYHADVRAPGPENAEIPLALMERSQMTIVIVGPMEPHAIDSLLKWLNDATAQSSWRCPHVLFMLPPSAVWITNKVNSMAWPPMLQVHVHNESLTSASSVWNALLGTWNRVKAQPGWEPSISDAAEFAVEVTDITMPPHEPELAAMRPAPAVAVAQPMPIVRPAPTSAPKPLHNMLDHAHVKRQLAQMLTLDGMLGCAVVDASNGLILARETPDDTSLDLDVAAAACTQALKAHKTAAVHMGMPDALEEVMTSTASRHQVMRQLSQHPDLFLFALLDRQRTNLALARYKLMEVERELV